MTPTPEMIEAAAKTMNTSWWEDDACHCERCTAEHQELLESAKAALTAALAVMEKDQQAIIERVQSLKPADPSKVKVIPRAQYDALVALNKAGDALKKSVERSANPTDWFEAMAELFEKLDAISSAVWPDAALPQVKPPPDGG